MAVGFPPLSTATFSYQRFNPTQFLVMAVHAMQQAGWSVELASREGVAAKTAPTIKNPGQRIVLHLSEYEVKAYSYSLGNQLKDGGANQENLATLSQNLEKILLEGISIMDDKELLQLIFYKKYQPD